MEALALKPRQPVQEEIECWDDDGDLQGLDDLHFRNVSSTTVSSVPTSHHRDSISSRLSTRSDMDGDEDWQVLLPIDDETSTSNAIASAKSAGIPIPDNVPTSALLGGTIKRLGGRKVKKFLGDDWGDDLELPKPEQGGLRLKKNDEQAFPETLRQISAAFSSTPGPEKSHANPLSFMERLQSAGRTNARVAALERFRDDDNDDFDDVPTIKVAKGRVPPKQIEFLHTPAKSVKAPKEMENFEDDLELPSDGKPLQLSARKEHPKTPSHPPDDFDIDWAEGSQGSLGTSHGGTRRAGRSNRSSSISARSPSIFSPSLSSCLTAESEDEGWDGLEVPDGPLHLEEALKKRKENASPDPTDGKKPEVRAAAKEDFFSGIEIGDGDVFDSGKLTLNRNVKHKVARQTSPKRTETRLTFTNKPQAVITRIPKLQAQDRARSKLESVSESGAPLASYRQSQPRLGGHSAQNSLSSIPTPSHSSFPSTSGPSTPSRRGLNSKSSRDALRQEPTTTSSQLLKSKRSIPTNLRNQPSPARPSQPYQRPPSRSDYSTRGIVPPRPKTPIDRSGAESSLASFRKPPVPFLPAGHIQAQSHHISSKPSRIFPHRPRSSDSNENVPFNRPLSRLSNPHHRPHTPNSRRDVATESLAREAASKIVVKRPPRRRAFGDGSELDVFDDLPTSATAESKFTKQPVGRGTVRPSNLRNKLNSSQNPSLTSIAQTDISGPLTPLSPQKPPDANIPRFARDTAASRLAREQRTGTLNPFPLRHVNSAEQNSVLTPVNTNWKAHVAAKSVASPRPHGKRSGKQPRQQPRQQPRLIKALGHEFNDAKTVNNMQWNPQLCRWEGNENALAPFDVPVSTAPGSPKAASSATLMTKPALIANVGSVKGVQVVGGMVFDPERMCWLKNPLPSAVGHGKHGSRGMSPATEDDEEDPFAGLDDLEDGDRGKAGTAGTTAESGKEGNTSFADDEWLVGEEFDVGPEFVRRQRVEEEKWRRKVEGWVGAVAGREEGDGWKWAIWGLVCR